ncbi:MAG: hypothetical protein JWP89_3170 [Schlesneria sp.]|nr:hypothetical protein [Schlesneria sp.]
MRHLRIVAGTFICLSVMSASAPLFAKDSDDAAKKSDLPSCLSKLKLTDDQKSKAKEVVQKYDDKIDKVMKHFSDKYLETVETEAALLTSVEDVLSEQQRENIRNERHKAAHSDKDTDKSDDKSKAVSSSDTKSGKATAVIEEIDEITFSNGVTLTVEQEAIADRITNKHMAHLRALHRRVHSIHNRLIALETDKIVELEKLLTKEQLSQLRQDRQAAAGDAHATAAPSK